MEWVVLAALLLAGLVAAVGLWLGLRDPVVRHYKPGGAGLFFIGRTALRPEHGEGLDQAADDGSRKNK